LSKIFENQHSSSYCIGNEFQINAIVFGYMFKYWLAQFYNQGFTPRC